MITPFVDIGGLVHHYCLSFLSFTSFFKIRLKIPKRLYEDVNGNKNLHRNLKIEDCFSCVCFAQYCSVLHIVVCSYVFFSFWGLVCSSLSDGLCLPFWYHHFNVTLLRLDFKCVIYFLFLCLLRFLLKHITRLTRRVSLVEKGLLILSGHLRSSPVLSGVRFTRSLVLCVCFVNGCLSFCPFSFGHCIFSPLG